MFNVKVVKYPPMLRGRITFEPEFDDALETIGARLERPGKGLGERRNIMNRQREARGIRFTYSTEHYPRRTGRAKRDKLTGIFKGMSGNVVRKMMKRIQERWAAEGRSE